MEAADPAYLQRVSSRICKSSENESKIADVDLTDYFWIVHFRDKRDDSDTEELDQPVPLINIE